MRPQTGHWLTGSARHDHPVPTDVLTTRALNRTTLRRQLLLERAPESTIGAVHHLVGMQAQVPQNPYVGLWSRLDGFRLADLEQALLDRHVVRIACLRGTVHLVAADDALLLRPLCQPIFDADLRRHAQLAPRLEGVDLGPVDAAARALLDDRALTTRQLADELALRFPGLHALSLAQAMRNRLDLVQVPPRGLWHRSGQATHTTATSWLGRPLVEAPSIDEVVLRYLAAFGPATVADVSTWCRLTGVREVVERLRPKLRSYRDEEGRELFDLRDASITKPDVPAPVRFLPEYDNVLLSHADRSRVIPALEKACLWHQDRYGLGTVLADGFATAVWRTDVDRERGRVTIIVEHLRRLSKRTASSISAEARRLLRFTHPDAEHDVRFHHR